MHRWQLPQQSSLPLRVCTPCYNQLSSPAQQTGKFAGYFFSSSQLSGTAADSRCHPCGKSGKVGEFENDRGEVTEMKKKSGELTLRKCVVVCAVLLCVLCLDTK